MSRNSAVSNRQKKAVPAVLPSKRGKDKDRQFVAALGRGLEILQCFSPTEPEIGSAEIADMIGLPQPTVWRLCYTLMAKGFLTLSPFTKRLRLGMPVLGLSHAVVAGQSIAEIARLHMQSIADRVGGTVSLGAPDGLKMIYLQRCEGPSIILVNHRVGSRVPLGYSASGWGYLAGLPPETREGLLKQIREAEGPSWAQVERRFKLALKGYQKDGYIVNKGTLHRQINGVAVSIRFPDDVSHLSLSASGINSIFTDEKLRMVGMSLVELASMLESVPPEQRMLHGQDGNVLENISLLPRKEADPAKRLVD